LGRAPAPLPLSAYFLTAPKQLDVRTIQGEILDHKGSLLPFADIPPYRPRLPRHTTGGRNGDAAGHSKSPGQSAQVLFMPDSAIRTAEVQPLLTELYSRAFIWFGKEKPGEMFTLGNLLSYISEMTLRDPAELQEAIRKTWKSYYHFNTPFNPNARPPAASFPYWPTVF
jgi:hypothetical protein